MLELSLGRVHVTPTASARKAWLPRSPDSSFAHARFWTSLVSFHFAFFYFGYFLFATFNAFFIRSHPTRTLVSGTLAAAT